MIRTAASPARTSAAVLFALAAAYAGVGLVSPVLPALAADFDATAAQTTLLFVSYMVAMGAGMLTVAAIAARIGQRATLIVGITAIAACAAVCSLSTSIAQLVGLRAGWGLGNALFIAASLAVVVGASTTNALRSATYFEASIAGGSALGPLVGGLLGQSSWRISFLGAAILAGAALLVLVFFLPSLPRPKDKSTPIDSLVLLSNKTFATWSVMAAAINFVLFLVLSYAPFVLHVEPYAIGLMLCAWSLSLGVSSVVIVPKLCRHLTPIRTVYVGAALLAASLLVAGVCTANTTALVSALVGTGIALGILQPTLTTGALTSVPSGGGTASSAFAFVRFAGAGVAPWLAVRLANTGGPGSPFLAATVLVTVVTVVGSVLVARTTGEAEPVTEEPDLTPTP